MALAPHLIFLIRGEERDGIAQKVHHKAVVHAAQRAEDTEQIEKRCHRIVVPLHVVQQARRYAPTLHQLSWWQGSLIAQPVNK